MERKWVQLALRTRGYLKDASEYVKASIQQQQNNNNNCVLAKLLLYGDVQSKLSPPTRSFVESVNVQPRVLRFVA